MNRFYIFYMDVRSGFMLQGIELPYDLVDRDVAQEVADQLNKWFGSSFQHYVGTRQEE